MQVVASVKESDEREHVARHGGVKSKGIKKKAAYDKPCKQVDGSRQHIQGAENLHRAAPLLCCAVAAT